MAFTDRIAQAVLATQFYVRVSGLPYYFSNAATPTGWALAGGYSWSATLVVEPGWATVSSEAQLLDGKTQSGALGFTFKIEGNQPGGPTDLWDDLLKGSVRRTDKNQTTITVDLDVDDVVEAVVVNSNGFGVAGVGDVYAGLETIGYTSKATAQKFTTLTRGKYGSKALHHLGQPDREVELGSGGYWTDYPIAWGGRKIELWLATGSREGGVFSPYGADAQSSEDQMIYSGLIQNVARSDDGLRAAVSTAAIVQLNAREIAARLPRARAGLPLTHSLKVHVADDNRWLSWARIDRVNGGEASLGTGSIHSPNAPLELQSDSIGTLVTEGLYPNNEIQSFLRWTIQNEEWTAFQHVSVSLQFEGSGAALRYVIVISYDVASAYEWDLSLFVNRGPQESILRELGFTEDLTSEPHSLVAAQEPYVYTFVAQRAPPLFRWPPASYNGVRRLYIWDQSGPAFSSAWSYTQDDGTTIPQSIKLGKHEIMAISGVAVDAANGLTYLTVSTRGLGGTVAEDEIYIPQKAPEDQKFESVVQGVSFLGTSGPCSSIRMALYLMLGGSGVNGHNHATYDRGWRGSGAYIDVDFVDVDTFLDYDARLNLGRNNYFFAKAEELRKVLQAEFVQERLFIVPKFNTSTGRFQISLARVEPPNESDDGVAHVLDDSILWETGPNGQPFNDGHELIVNAVDVKTGWDNSSGKYRYSDIHHTDAASIATWGKKQPVSLELRGFAGLSEALAKTQDVALEIFNAWGAPFVVVDFSCAKAKTWEWQIGDAVSVTAALMPKDLEAGRGVTAMVGRIYAKRDAYNPTTSSANGRTSAIFSVLTIAFRRYGGARFSNWSPTMRIIGKTSAVDFTAADNEYSASTSPLKDWERFAAGWRVKCFTPGDESTAVSAVILSVIAGAVVLVGPGVALAVPFDMVSDKYDTASIDADQKKFVAISDADGILDKASGDDFAFTYQ